jgi:hypothetical protein
VNEEKARERALLQVLHREIDRLEEERIQLKTDNRKRIFYRIYISQWLVKKKK